MVTTTQVDKVYTCRCKDFTFQVLVMLFLPISMSMALSSFHKFLAFGLPNRSQAKLSFDLISELGNTSYFDQTCCFNYGFQASYWTTWCKNGKPGKFEILPRLFPLPRIFDPWQDRTWKLQIQTERNSVKRCGGFQLGAERTHNKHSLGTSKWPELDEILFSMI